MQSVLCNVIVNGINLVYLIVYAPTNMDAYYMCQNESLNSTKLRLCTFIHTTNIYIIIVHIKLRDFLMGIHTNNY